MATFCWASVRASSWQYPHTSRRWDKNCSRQRITGTHWMILPSAVDWGRWLRVVIISKYWVLSDHMLWGDMWLKICCFMTVALDCRHFIRSYYLHQLPLWFSGQSSWLQIQRSGFDSRRYQIFWEVVSLERGPLRLVSTIDELLGRNSSSSGLEYQEYSRGDLLRWPRDTLYPQKLTLTSPTSSDCSVSILHSRTKATEFSFLKISPSSGWEWAK
jgi:hypothetical protein